MESTIDLSIEQEFMLRVFEEQVKNLSLEEAQNYLLETLRQSMVKENFLKEFFRDSV
jgi:Phycobilisome degradation protein nblA